MTSRGVISALLLVLCFIVTKHLSQVDADLRVMFQEYALAAVDLGHISGDVIRYRMGVRRALEARTQAEFEEMTATLPALRARIQHEVDRYAAASLRVARSGRSEPEDLVAVQKSLEAYFAAASRTVHLVLRSWTARSSREREQLREQAELQAADNAGPKLIQLSVALDHLLETVGDVAEDMRNDGVRAAQQTKWILLAGCSLLALVNLLWAVVKLRSAAVRRTTVPEETAVSGPRDR